MTCVGSDVAKDTHWACALDAGGRVLLNRAVRNAQANLDALSAELRPASAGGGSASTWTAPPPPSCKPCCRPTAWRWSMCRAWPSAGPRTATSGEPLGSTPAASASPIPRTPGSSNREVRRTSPTSSAPATACGRSVLTTTPPPACASSSAGAATWCRTRAAARRGLRPLLSQAHPSLEAKLDVTCKGPLALLTRSVTPAEINKASTKAITRHLRRTPNLRDPERLAEPARACAAQQRTTVPGGATLARLVRGMAAEALTARGQLAALDKELEAIVAAHPQGALVRSLPGMGAVLAAEFIATAGDITRFRSPAALAAAAGLAPVLQQSGQSRTLRRARRGDRDLKRILHQSAFCAFSTHPSSRAYCDRKRREGKHHVQAVIALARQRSNVLRAMLTHDKPYDPNHRAA